MTAPRHSTFRHLRRVAQFLVPLVLVTAGCDSASGNEDDGGTTKKKKKKKKRKKRDANRTSLTDEEMTAACERIIDKKLNEAIRDQKSCEKMFRRAWDKPNASSKYDGVKLAVGRHDCAMEASSVSKFKKCMREVFDAAKLREGKKITFRPAYLKNKSSMMSCSASVTRNGFKAQHLTKLATLCFFDGSNLVLETAGLSQATIGGKSLTVGSAKSRVSVPADDLRAALTFRSPSLGGKAPLGVPLQLTNDDGEWTGWFHLDDKLLADAIKGSKGLLLPGEDAGGAAGSAHLIIGAVVYSKQNQVIGEGKTLRDVGKIALVEEKRRKLETCRYRDSKGKSHTVTLRAKDAQVTIIERKSGRRLASKLIRAKGTKSCKSSVSKKDMHKKTTVYLPNDGAEIGRWAKAELAK